VVRGARGELALQVVRRGSAGYVSVVRSRAEQIPDQGVHVMAANLRVRAGDLIGVQLAPGAAIGVRRAVPGATTARWLGQFFVAPRPIELGAGTGFDHEILLRADYARGVRPAPSGRLSGRAAERAPHGRELRSLAVDVRGGARRVTVVALSDAVAVDLWAGGRRLARLPALDAQPTGRLLSFSTLGFGLPLLRWRNPDGRTLSQAYAVSARTLRPRG